jgi:hypothetical protein
MTDEGRNRGRQQLGIENRATDVVKSEEQPEG